MAEYLELDQTITDSEGRATPYFEDYLFGIITALGGEGSTLLDDNQEGAELARRIPHMIGSINRLMQRVEALESDLSKYQHSAQISQLQSSTSGYNSITKNVSYTANHNEWIEVSSGATITLPEFPNRNDRVRVSIGDNSGVKVQRGGLKRIKVRGSLQNDILFRTAGESFDFHFFVDIDQTEYWLVA